MGAGRGLSGVGELVLKAWTRRYLGWIAHSRGQSRHVGWKVWRDVLIILGRFLRSIGRDSWVSFFLLLALEFDAVFFALVPCFLAFATFSLVVLLFADDAQLFVASFLCSTTGLGEIGV